MTDITRMPGGAGTRLAAGRRTPNGLTSEQVVAHQRRRMLVAMADTVAEKGFAAATVGDVIARAGVSRATFYQQFSDKQECFLAAFDAAASQVIGRVGTAGTAVPARVPDPDAFEAVIAAYLQALLDAPQFARVFLVDISALGAEGVARRAAGQQRFAAAIARIVGARSTADRFACEALVAAIAGLVTARVAAGDWDGLRSLRQPIVELAGRLFPRS